VASRAPTWSRDQHEAAEAARRDAAAGGRGGGRSDDDRARWDPAGRPPRTAGRAASSEPDPLRGRRILKPRGGGDGDVRSASPPPARPAAPAPEDASGAAPAAAGDDRDSASSALPAHNDGESGSPPDAASDSADTVPAPGGEAAADRVAPVVPPLQSAMRRRDAGAVAPLPRGRIRVGGVTTTLAVDGLVRTEVDASSGDEDDRGRRGRRASGDARGDRVVSDAAAARTATGGGGAGGAGGGGGKPLPPRFRLILLVCFEHEDAFFEREWLQHLDTTCDDIELHINLSRVRSRSAVTSMRLQRLSVGRLSHTRLERLLPPRNLLAVSLCGTPRFQRDVREIYASLGLPKSLLMSVG
jgi:hypothetical protein